MITIVFSPEEEVIAVTCLIIKAKTTSDKSNV